MVRDDAHWKRVARGVARFRPRRRLTVSDSIDHTSEHGIVDTQSGPTATTPREQIKRVQSRDSPVESTFLRDTSDTHDSASAKRMLELEVDTDMLAAKRTKRTSFPRTRKGLNPAFRNPIPGYLRTSKESSEIPRPWTAPAPTVLVPVTTSPKPRRSLSEASSSSAPCISNSFPPDFVEDTSFVDKAFTNSESIEVRPLPFVDSDILEHNNFTAIQQRVTSNTNEARLVEDEQVVIEILSQTSIRSHELNMGTLASGSKGSKDQRTTYPNTNHHGQSMTSAASTETSSDPRQYLDTSSPLARRSMPMPNPSPTINLTDDPEGQDVTRRDVLGPISSPVRWTEESDASENVTPSLQRQFDTIRKLPRRIKCQTTNTNTNGQFRSFIPDYLLELAKQHDLLNHFRPCKAPQFIRNGERGYWKLLIRIADLSTVAKVRRAPLTGSQWSERRFMMRQEGQTDADATTPERDAALLKVVYLAKQPAEHTPWTADEFIQFWSYMIKTIERGRVGYDSRATIDGCREAGGELFLDIRVWCYAEVLSHIWLTLYGLSAKLTASMPLQWCIPGKGPSITMSGQPMHDGSLGRWVEQRSGVDGHWGLEEDWNGLTATARSRASIS